jgi:hypothetical protein
MGTEERVIKASFAAGMTDLMFGLIMYWAGWQEWYFQHFHTFGILGFGMIAYAVWHNHYLTEEVRCYKKKAIC